MATIGGTRFIRSGPDYGAWGRGGPYGVAIHCLQCAGTVDVSGLAGPGSYTDNAGVSPHTMSDRRQIVEVLGPDRSGAHVGGKGNPMLWGSEVTGYAEWTREQWLDNSAALLNQAKAVGKFWQYQGWSVNDLQWGSLDELRAARSRYEQGLGPVAPRLWIHWDVSKAIGGTTHWDVGSGYPFADFARWAREWVVGAGASGPSTGTAPEGGGAGGGAAGAETDWLSNAPVGDVGSLVVSSWARGLS